MLIFDSRKIIYSISPTKYGSPIARTKKLFTLMVRGGGDNFDEGRMLPHIYDEPLTGRNSPAFKSV